MEKTPELRPEKLVFNSFSSMNPAANIDRITEEILNETDYIEASTENGYPQYTEKEAIRAAKAVESEEDLDILRQLGEGADLYSIHYTGISEDLDRLEEAQMIERPSTGPEYVKLTRLSQTY